MQLNPFTFHAPETLKEALEVYARHERAKIKAGGTFLINNLKALKRRGAHTPEHVLSLSKISELKQIDQQGGRLLLGAMLTMDDILSADLPESLAVLKQVAACIGNTPIRNMATLGGNLTCRYAWTEMSTALVAIDALLHFCGADLKEQVLSAEEFFANGAKTQKILTHISCDVCPQARFQYQRVTRTVAADTPLLAVCVGGVPEGDILTQARVVINNGIVFACRDKDLEAYLTKNTMDDILTKGFPSLDKDLYTNRSDEYKTHMFGVSLKKALAALRKQT